ncbi:MAG: ABC transporter substrate-binding protein, partial [Chloroflexota bacterium]
MVLSGGLAGAALIGCSPSAPVKPAATTAPPAAGGSAAAARPGVPVVKGAPKDGGTWVEAVSLTSPQQDMHTALAQSIWHYISEQALKPDPWTGELTANIVEKWETPDSTTVVLHVRKGVFLHDRAPWNGREFDAEDLAFNINRIAGNTAADEGLQKSAFQRADTLGGMSKVEVTDKYTVKVTLARPSSAYLMGFLEWRNVLMPKGIVEVGFKDPLKFAGMGAYMLTDFAADVREGFVKHPKYYR